MKQKFQVLALLQQHFNQLQIDVNFIKIKKINAKKSIYKAGDVINHIYFIVSGQLTLAFQQKQTPIRNHIIIGDYQPSANLSRRISTLQTKSKVELVILPIDFYFNIKQSILQRQKFVSSHLGINDKRAKHLLIKCFQHKYMYRKQQVQLQHKQQQDLALIRHGIFIIKKYIGVSIIKKHKIQISKEFGLYQLGEGEFVRENIVCQSPKGEIFVCEYVYISKIVENFEEVKIWFWMNDHKKKSVMEREKSIKKICFPQSELLNSILPSVFIKSQNSSPAIKKKSRFKSEESFNIQEKNHYSVKRSPKNQLQTIPTFSNLLLIPLQKIRKFSNSKSTRLQQKEQSSKPWKNDKYSNRSCRKQEVAQQQIIPTLFDNKFKRKMFLKASNPFRHYKSKSLSLQQHMASQRAQGSFIKGRQTQLSPLVLHKIHDKQNLHIQYKI